MTDERALDEADLVQRCAAGEREAWDTFVHAYGPLIRALAMRMLARRTGRANATDADEVAADVFLALLRRDRILLRRYDPRWRLATYLGVICRTAVVRRIQRESRQGGQLEAPERVPEPGHRPGPQALLEAAEQQQALTVLREALEAASPRDRLLLTLRYLEERPYEEIAAAVGVSPASVGPLLGRARARLARRLPGLARFLSGAPPGPRPRE